MAEPAHTCELKLNQFCEWHCTKCELVIEEERVNNLLTTLTVGSKKEIIDSIYTLSGSQLWGSCQYRQKLFHSINGESSPKNLSWLIIPFTRLSFPDALHIIWEMLSSLDWIWFIIPTLDFPTLWHVILFHLPTGSNPCLLWEKLLYHNGCPLDMQVGPSSLYPSILEYALRRPSSNSLEWFIQNGVDPTVIDQPENIPIHLSDVTWRATLKEGSFCVAYNNGEFMPARVLTVTRSLLSSNKDTLRIQHLGWVSYFDTNQIRDSLHLRPYHGKSISLNGWSRFNPGRSPVERAESNPLPFPLRVRIASAQREYMARLTSMILAVTDVTQLIPPLIQIVSQYHGRTIRI